MRILDRFAKRVQLQEGIRFLHKEPARPNLGDALCSPKNYFDFSAERPALIVGGGAFNGLGVNEARHFTGGIRIAWGIGQSWRLEKPAEHLNLRAVRGIFAIATTRDPQFANEDVRLLPCVSVLHPVVDIPPGAEHGIFFNHDEAASGEGIDAIIRDEQESQFVAVNSAPEREFTAAFARAGELTTNSYHAAYWGLLSGRAVRLLGYSTKFPNLLSLLGLPVDAFTPYHRGDTASLADALKRSGSRPALVLSDAASIKGRFRAMNHEFAASLAQLGINAVARRGRRDFGELSDT
jgi:hypothetical protein